MKTHSYYVARQQEQHLGLTSSYPPPASLILIWFDSSHLQTICQSSVTPHTTTTCLCAADGAFLHICKRQSCPLQWGLLS